MPIGVSPRVSQNQVRDYLPVDAYAVVKGFAVALINDEGTMKIVPCSADTYSGSFIGFADATQVLPGRIPIVSAAGSYINPCVENGDPLVPGGSVWLSSTPGRVTQTVPSAPGCRILRVGVALNPLMMILVKEPSPQVG